MATPYTLCDRIGRRGKSRIQRLFFCLLLTRQPRLKRLVIFSERPRVIEELAIDSDCVVSQRLVDAHKLIPAQLHDDIAQVINRLMHDLEIRF